MYKCSIPEPGGGIPHVQFPGTGFCQVHVPMPHQYWNPIELQVDTMSMSACFITLGLYALMTLYLSSKYFSNFVVRHSPLQYSQNECRPQPYWTMHARARVCWYEIE